jgi:DNA processing protein
MTLDQAIALSLVPSLSRVGLTARLKAPDPDLWAQGAGLVERARLERERASRQDIHALAWNDPRLPAALAALEDLPPVLWYRGELGALDVPAVAIVGSRAASIAALETAARLGADLAARGLAVVSGLARGVDSAAHRGALRTGRTIAVLGSGLDRIYPSEHAPLAAEIARTGLVLSEFAPATPPLPHHFPMRNRLISGLSLAVVVIEASERSGSLITAACALEQGREVMVVPSNVLHGRNRGGHALLRDGATLIETADDIVAQLPRIAGLSGDPARGTPQASRDPLLRNMEAGHAYDLDELSGLSGLDLARLLPRLMELEMGGLVRRAGGGRFLRSS